MEIDFEKLLEAVEENKYVKKIDDDFYLSSFNEDALRKQGFDMSNDHIERLLQHYREVENRKNLRKKQRMESRKRNINDSLKRSWSKLLVGFISVIIVIALFYWYEWRPSQIRKECGNETKYGQLSTQEERYKSCIRGKGISN